MQAAFGQYSHLGFEGNSSKNTLTLKWYSDARGGDYLIIDIALEDKDLFLRRNPLLGGGGKIVNPRKTRTVFWRFGFIDARIRPTPFKQ